MAMPPSTLDKGTRSTTLGASLTQKVLTYETSCVFWLCFQCCLEPCVSQKKDYAVQGPRSNPDSTASPISGVCAQWGILFQSRLWEEETETAWLCVPRSAVSAESYFRNPGLPPPDYLSHASLTLQPSLSYSPFLEQHHWSHSLPDLISLGHFRQ